MGKDYYAILGINRSASSADIQKSYRKLSLKYHPQKNHELGARDKFAEIAEAYNVLCYPARKATYDKFGEEGLKTGVPSGDGGFVKGYTFHGDPFKVFQVFFGSNPFSFSELFNYEDLLAADGYPAFGGLKGRSQPRQDPPIERDLLLTLEEIYNGCIKKMEISRKVLNDDGFTTSMRKKIITITVSRGWKEGTRITFPKEGDQGPNKIPADIVFIVKDKPHPHFSRKDHDLILRPEILLIKALTGGSIEVHTLDDRIITVSINEVISPGYCKTVVGEGMPLHHDPSLKGNLLIQFGVVFPAILSPQQQALIKQALQ